VTIIHDKFPLQHDTLSCVLLEAVTAAKGRTSLLLPLAKLSNLLPEELRQVVKRKVMCMSKQIENNYVLINCLTVSTLKIMISVSDKEWRV
jgi:hypothetical protein